MSQGGHPHGAGQGGVPVPPGGGRLRAVRPLHPHLPCAEAAGAPHGTGGVRRVEPRCRGAAGVHRRRRVLRSGGVRAGGRRRGVRRGAGRSAPCGPHSGEKRPRAASPAGRQAGAERHRRDVPAGAALSGSGPPGAVFRHTMSGGWPVPLSGGASGASCDLRCGVQRRVQPRGVGQTGELHGLRQAAPPRGGGVLRQAQRRSGAALPRPVRGRRPLRCTGSQVGAGPRSDPRPVPAACSCGLPATAVPTPVRIAPAT